VLRVEPITDADAIGSWRYDGLWSVYDGTDEPLAELARFVAVREVHPDASTSLFGFACFDADARVPGVDADPQVLDLGWGMRPDAVGRGRGVELVTTVIDHAKAVRPAMRELRVVVQSWNLRGQRVAERAGFTARRSFTVDPAAGGGAVEYTELRRPW
jgi:RimJ/RimL family protein N-acetyltransferase